MTGPWSMMDPLSVHSNSDSSSSEDEEEKEKEKEKDEDDDDDSDPSQEETVTRKSQNKVEIKKKQSLDFVALSKHGYSGGPSVLYVPPPKESNGDQDWSWSCGKRKEENDVSESIEEREITQQRANEGAIQAAAQAIAEHNYAKRQRREAAAEARALSFSQKEKRKRDLGQSSRGKNYVEEEKRLLRDQGVYSGFDA